MPRSRKATSPQRTTGSVALLIGTRKGAFILRGDRTRRTWKLSAPMFLGHIVHHRGAGPARPTHDTHGRSTGHLGPTLFRSTDFGKTWKEATTPPAFPKAPEGQKGRVVDHVFWLTPGHRQRAGHWYAGTSPQGLFRSNDGGVTWEPFSVHQRRSAVPRVDGHRAGRHPGWTEAALDPRRPTRSQAPLLRHVRRRCARIGRRRPNLDAHRARARNGRGVRRSHCHLPRPPLCPALSDQSGPVVPTESLRNLPDGSDLEGRWVRIGKNMPKKVGDIGFPMVLHPRDADTAWVFPMDGSTVWPRVSPGGKPAAYVTRNGGKTWMRQDKGFPAHECLVDGETTGDDGGCA